MIFRAFGHSRQCGRNKHCGARPRSSLPFLPVPCPTLSPLLPFSPLPPEDTLLTFLGRTCSSLRCLHTPLLSANLEVKTRTNLLPYPGCTCLCGRSSLPGPDPCCLPDMRNAPKPQGGTVIEILSFASRSSPGIRTTVV